jgi:selenocysteine-specific translation elongation factor
VANKIDLLSPAGLERERLEKVKNLAQELNLPFFSISAIKGEGLRPLVNELYQILQKEKEHHGQYETNE